MAREWGGIHAFTISKGWIPAKAGMPNAKSSSFLDSRPGQALREARSQLTRHPEGGKAERRICPVLSEGQILRRLPLADFSE
jgi:hypothetical protein